MFLRSLALTFLISVPAIAQDATPLKVALEKQAQHKTVSVDVRQTKKIPALNDPIVQKGHLWLEPGKAFRWELGKPATQTAIYDGEQVYMFDEEKKTAKGLSPSDRKAKPLLLMLGIGEGATYDGLTQAFRIADTTTVKNSFVVSLVPKGSLKRAIKHMTMQVNTRTSFLERIEWTQKGRHHRHHRVLPASSSTANSPPASSNSPAATTSGSNPSSAGRSARYLVRSPQAPLPQHNHYHCLSVTFHISVPLHLPASSQVYRIHLREF